MRLQPRDGQTPQNSLPEAEVPGLTACVVRFRSPEASAPALWTSLQAADIHPTLQVCWVPPQPSQHSLLLLALPTLWWDSEGGAVTKKIAAALRVSASSSGIPPREEPSGHPLPTL